MQHAGEQWSSRAAFLLASMGTAIGLGNVWRFPYLAGTNGGGAFIAVYILIVCTIGIPGLIATLMIGRRGRGNPVEALRSIASAGERSRSWVAIGWLSVTGTFLLLSFYSVIGSWTLRYAHRALTVGFGTTTADNSRAVYESILGDPVGLAGSHAAFMLMTAIVVALGVKSGLQRLSGFAMPALFVAMVLLAAYALTVGDAAAGLRFLFTVDFSKITLQTLVQALSQALFSLSVGGAGMIIYGAYLGNDISITRSVPLVALADTSVSLLAGVVIFPMLFLAGLAPTQGPGLVFVALPIAFATMPFGDAAAFVLFMLVFFAAITTAIAMLESVVSVVRERAGWSRPTATAATATVAWCIGLISVLSFGPLAHLRPLAGLARFGSMNAYQVLDDVVSNIVLPASALGMIVVAGWVMRRDHQYEEVGAAGAAARRVWSLAIRVFVPAALFVILLTDLLRTRA